MAQHIEYHKDGSIWAKGEVVNDQPEGYWEWFGKDGTKTGSGHFKSGKKAGEWITYDKMGAVSKITNFDSKKKVYPHQISSPS